MKILYSLLIFLSVSILLIWPKISYADGDDGHHAGNHGEHQYYHYHDRPYFGRHVDNFYPNEYYWVSVGGSRYYYDDGIYYDYVGGNYVVVRPPIGAIVATIPSDFRLVVIGGMTYYTDNGIYYVYTPTGYLVVSPPVVQSVPVTAVNGVVQVQSTYGR